MNQKKLLTRGFYMRPAEIVAKELLGKYFVRILNDQRIIGKIVETEAYLGATDEAAHSFIGETKRNFSLYGEGGFTYVHSIHRYHCIDLVTEAAGHPTSVLIRALEPIEGIDLMKMYRGINDPKNLTNGPGKLCQALNINRELNAIDVTKTDSPIYILDAENIPDNQIAKTQRRGISKAKDLELRFFIKESDFVS